MARPTPPPPCNPPPRPIEAAATSATTDATPVVDLATVTAAARATVGIGVLRPTPVRLAAPDVVPADVAVEHSQAVNLTLAARRSHRC